MSGSLVPGKKTITQSIILDSAHRLLPQLLHNLRTNISQQNENKMRDCFLGVMWGRIAHNPSGKCAIIKRGHCTNAACHATLMVCQWE
jgi:hypothetical protein